MQGNAGSSLSPVGDLFALKLIARSRHGECWLCLVCRNCRAKGGGGGGKLLRKAKREKRGCVSRQCRSFLFLEIEKKN